MQKQTDIKTEDYLKPRPIATGDLMETTNRLEWLLGHSDVKGLLAISHLVSPIYIALPKSASSKHKSCAIRIVFTLAAMGGLFSSIQAINNEDNLPPRHTVVKAHPDVEKHISNHLINNRSL